MANQWSFCNIALATLNINTCRHPRLARHIRHPPDGLLHLVAHPPTHTAPAIAANSDTSASVKSNSSTARGTGKPPSLGLRATRCNDERRLVADLSGRVLRIGPRHLLASMRRAAKHGHAGVGTPVPQHAPTYTKRREDLNHISLSSGRKMRCPNRLSDNNGLR